MQVLLLVACSGGGGSSHQASSTSAELIPSVATAVPSVIAGTASASPAQSIMTPHQLPTVSSQPSALVTSNAIVSTQAVPVHVQYQLPTSSSTSSILSRSRIGQSALKRNLEYISTSNTLLTISVTPLGGSATVYGPTACTQASCTVSFTATPGANTLVFTLTDNSNNVLASFSTLQFIQPATENTLNLTANPAVSSVVVQLGTSTVNAGSTSNVLVTVNAKDADGNSIVGNSSYVDTQGNPVTLSLNVANAASGGKGTVTIQGPTVMTAPAQVPIYAHYDGNWLNSATISVSTTSSTINNLTAATMNIVPTATEYSYVSNTANHLMTYGPAAGITVGSDGNLWIPEFGSNNGSCMLKSTISGTLTEYCTGISSGAGVIYDTLGYDGNLWFTEQYSNKIASITPGGNVQEYSASASGYWPIGITKGPDGAIWFIQQGNNYIDRIAGGVLNSYATSAVQPRSIVFGSDQNIWFASRTSPLLSRMTIGGQEADFSYTDTCGGYNDGIVNGPDGNIWFVECDDQTIGRSTLNGTITSFSSGISSSANIRNMVVGPDSNIYFTEMNANKIGSITTSGVVTEYTTGIGSGADPFALTVGPDGNLWFTEAGTNKIAKFVL